ncbi:MAG TPA: glycosyltransferase family A protein [Anaerolineae bacterium]|nr:glycosyltransferase family A protein [Anaerolineae bacterium]
MGVRAVSQVGNHPTFSVILPTYNRAHLLAQALQSVREQTDQDFEIIVVDDASTDQTRSVVDTLASPRLRYIRNSQNLGAAASRNIAAQQAQGRYLAFLDSDDRWLPLKLSWQRERFSAGTKDNLAVVYGSVLKEKTDGRQELQRARYRGDVKDIILTYKGVVTGSLSSVVVERQAFLAVGGFDEKLPARQDYELFLRMSLAGYRFDFVAEPVAIKQIFGQDRITANHRKRVLGAIYTFKKHKAVFLAARKSDHFESLMRASERLTYLNHPRLSYLVYRYVLKHARPPAWNKKYLGFYLKIPSLIVARYAMNRLGRIK